MKFCHLCGSFKKCQCLAYAGHGHAQFWKGKCSTYEPFFGSLDLAKLFRKCPFFCGLLVNIDLNDIQRLVSSKILIDCLHNKVETATKPTQNASYVVCHESTFTICIKSLMDQTWSILNPILQDDQICSIVLQL